MKPRANISRPVAPCKRMIHRVCCFLGILLAVVRWSLTILSSFATWLDKTVGSQSIIVTLWTDVGCDRQRAALWQPAWACMICTISDGQLHLGIMAYCAGNRRQHFDYRFGCGWPPWAWMGIDFIWYTKKVSLIAALLDILPVAVHIS